MGRIEPTLVIVIVAVSTYSGASLAQQEIGTAADLTAVIALQAKPCGKVVKATKQGEDDYVAECQDGNRYHVFVKDGRVIVEKIG